MHRIQNSLAPIALALSAIAAPMDALAADKPAAPAEATATSEDAVVADGPFSIYGNLYVSVESVKAEGSAVSSNDLVARNRVSSNSSYIGIRGSQSLGGELQAWYQVENSVRPDTPAAGDTFASRNSAVGLRGGWGSIFIGQWDTPYKNATGRLDPFGNTSIAGYSNVLGGGTTSTAANAATRQGFDRRQRNIIEYWAPEVGGVSARVGYSVNEEKNTCTVACNPSLFSMSLGYRLGGLYLVAAGERHNEYANTATVRTKDTGVKVGVGYTFAGSHTVGLLWEKLTFQGNLAATALPKTFTAGTSNEASLKTYFVSYKGDFGRHNVRASYGQNKNVSLNSGSAPDTGARHMAVGYGYEVFKLAELMVYYTKVTNQKNSRNDFAVNGILGGAVNNGADPQGLGVGLRYRF